MLINYDPDGKPTMPPGFMQRANDLRMHAVCVICDEPGAVVGDHTGVSFWALTPFVPRKGDEIMLDDGKLCTVESVCFRTVTRRDAGGKAELIVLHPIVGAILVTK